MHEPYKMRLLFEENKDTKWTILAQRYSEFLSQNENEGPLLQSHY